MSIFFKLQHIFEKCLASKHSIEPQILNPQIHKNKAYSSEVNNEGKFALTGSISLFPAGYFTAQVTDFFQQVSILKMKQLYLSVSFKDRTQITYLSPNVTNGKTPPEAC